MSRESILAARYLLPGETEQDMYERVARVVYPNDDFKATTFRQLMETKTFLPNSPTLVNLGTSKGGSASACFVVPTSDSLIGIADTVTNMMKIHKAFGGTGFDLSVYRPEGDTISTTGGSACGPIAVMELLNQVASTVRQGGIREGANMGVLNVSHPDIIKFIHCKEVDGCLSHFNISVAVTDDFMEAVENNTDWDLTYNGIVYQTVPAKILFEDICLCAERTGDPGLIFIDEINRNNPYPVEITATNPCGEQPLPPNGSCNLGSINLSVFLRHTDSGEPYFDITTFETVVRFAIRTLDAIIDVNNYPTEDIAHVATTYRPIGLGVMGWASLLEGMHIDYASEEALSILNHIGECLNTTAFSESELMGKELGCAKDCDRRNITLLTIAPTGTLSLLADCSWGIEPHFGTTITKDSEEGSSTHTYNVDKSQTAMGMSWDWHVAHLVGWQHWVDNAVSKTINLPSTATAANICDIYTTAHLNHCKGITIYREGSKQSQVIHAVLDNRPDIEDTNITTVGTRTKFNSGCGQVRVECDCLKQTPNVPYEVVVLTSGGCKANNEAMGKIISKYIHDPRLSGRELDTIDRICKTLLSVECSTAMRNTKSDGKSCPAIIGKYMKEVWSTLPITVDNEIKCPSCGNPIIHEGGCGTGVCPHCGWGGCS